MENQSGQKPMQGVAITPKQEENRKFASQTYQLNSKLRKSKSKKKALDLVMSSAF
jgi:hypothetical protein